MGKIAAMQKSNRNHNSGGVSPDLIAIVNTLCIAIERCKKQVSEQIDLDKLVCAFLLLWLNNKLTMITSVDDIPDIKRVSGNKECIENRVRIIRENNISWVEYALLYHTKLETSYHWQPVPELLNTFYLTVFKKFYDNLLNKHEKNALLKIIIEPWKTPQAFKYKQRVSKNRFYSYIPTMVKQDPYLSLTSKSVLLPTEQLHHKSACAYQQERSDHICRHIFDFQNQQLLLIQQTLNKLEITLPYLQRENKRPDYLCDNSRIPTFIREQTETTHSYRERHSALFGSSRALSRDDVRQFFAHLHQELKNIKGIKGKALNIRSYREYYNFYTYVLAFEFLLLTGCRPTHAISIEIQRNYDFKQVMVKDKGRFRSLYLCDYLKKRIESYRTLQQALLTQLGLSQDFSYLWFLVDDNDHIVHLRAKSIRQFMQSHWPKNTMKPKNKVVPYCLRHTFAQTAASSMHPKLTNQQIDLLMGHSNFGEHLGCAQRFPASRNIIENYLNQLPEYFFLSIEL